MKVKGVISALSLCASVAGLLGLAAGCSDSEVDLVIQPFSPPRVVLQVNQPYIHKVVLSRKVNEKTYVDLDFESNQNFLELPEFVIFKPGDQIQTVDIVGKAATSLAKGEYQPLTFTLRDKQVTRDWYYVVEGGSTPGPTPDSGPPPPQPDMGPQPDTGPAPDGPAPDGPAPDGPTPDTAPQPDTAPDA